MSDTSDNDSENTEGESETDQPPDGGQNQSQGQQQSPQGQQPPQQPQGQQQPPQGTQPQQQPPQGQQPPQQAPQGQQPPQGGQYQQRQAQQGPSIADIFSRPDTKEQIKLGVIVFALLGIGSGLALFGVGNVFSPSASSGAGAGTTGGSAGSFGAAFAAALLGPALMVVPIAISSTFAVVIGFRQHEALDETPDTLTYATAGATCFLGAITTFLISWIFAGMGLGSVSFQNAMVPMFLTGLGSAVIAAGIIWTKRSFMADPQPPQPQPPRQH